MSLERAFLLAGANAVMATLWPAGDTYDVALMKRRYEILSKGADEGAAFHQAKVDLLKEFGDQAPFIYWAGFTLVGDGSTAVFAAESSRMKRLRSGSTMRGVVIFLS